MVSNVRYRAFPVRRGSTPRGSGGINGPRSTSDAGQVAIVLVTAISILMATLGLVMATTTVDNNPLLQTDQIQHYSYRAVEAGLNTFDSVINNNPNLANCNSTANSSALCKGLKYQVWDDVPGTTEGNGIIPEYYLFDNPQPQLAANGSLTSLDVEIIGAAGFPGHFVYQTIMGEFQPINGYLANVWWSDFAGSNPNGTGAEYQHIKYTAATAPAPQYVGDYEGEEANQCSYVWQTSSSPAPYTLTNNGTGGAKDDVGPCGDDAPPFTSGDTINGPLYSNDSIKVSNDPNFGVTGTPAIVTTADPSCLYTDAGTFACSNAVGVSSSSSTNGNPIEQSPVDNNALQTIAAVGGCLYQGPTQITLAGTQMTVISPDTPASPSPGTGCPNPAASGATWTGTTGSLPANGVVYVQTASSANQKTGANPFDDSGTLYPSDNGKYAQTLPSCSGCYDGQTASPDEEGDAFVRGHLSGLLTIGTSNDVIIDGNLTYDDCVNWATANSNLPVFQGLQQESACQYNAAGSGHINDVLGLVADQFIEVNHPIDPANNTDVLPFCGNSGSVKQAGISPTMGSVENAPMCTPDNNQYKGLNDVTQGNLVIDASVLALNQSFAANNPGAGPNMDQIILYGSIQQEARGPIGGGTLNANSYGAPTSSSNHTGYGKFYTWDPRLELVSPPSYLNPTDGSYALASSAVTDSTTCPSWHQPTAYTSNGASEACTAP